MHEDRNQELEKGVVVLGVLYAAAIVAAIAWLWA